MQPFLPLPRINFFVVSVDSAYFGLLVIHLSFELLVTPLVTHLSFELLVTPLSFPG